MAISEQPATANETGRCLSLGDHMYFTKVLKDSHEIDYLFFVVLVTTLLSDSKVGPPSVFISHPLSPADCPLPPLWPSHRHSSLLLHTQSKFVTHELTKTSLMPRLLHFFPA
ncbi:hypothetical protein BDY19DRAFT_997875 [Irpex rosettiformis]|uniref:Uncharacterized protein n=1 Tax=Irpex rosettiformis TaxID=378272 RepID=A0ACB8TQM5_9APHY|nr:hypothetical protein BDY19DRAFT_997875 [Irpex rosettiformis]